MKEGDIVLTPVPQADGSIKNRPAILVREFPPYKDFLVCGVSTQLHLLRQLIRNFVRVEDLAQHLSHRAHVYRNRAVD